MNKYLWLLNCVSVVHVAAILAAVNKRPNKVESTLLSLLEKLYPGEWMYVGDEQLIIGGKCPDFANINGKKMLIELFGEYWHRNDNPQDRINHFDEYGYSTLVLWTAELLNEKLMLSKIENFTQED